MSRAFNTLCAVAAVLAIVSPGHAAVVKVTASGVVENGVDGAGVFAAAGTDLTGQAFQATFNIDTGKGYVTGGFNNEPIFPGGPSAPDAYYSFLHNSGAPAAVTGSLNIDGNSYTVDGSKFGVNAYSALFHNGGHDDLLQDVASSSAELSLYDGFDPIFPRIPGIPGDGAFHDPNLDPQSFSLDYSALPGVYFPGNFSLNNGAGSTSLGLDGVQVSYTVISAGGGPTSFVSSAPEPLAWILMMAGVGVVGTTLRATKNGWRRIASRPI